MILMVIILISCSAFNESLCSFSEKRLDAIKQQRSILVKLKGEDRLGKKKAALIDKQLSEEEAAEIQRVKARCPQ